MRLSNGEVLLSWPLERHSLTAGMYYEDGTPHSAIDLACRWENDTAKPIWAAESGRVVWVQHWDGHTKTGVQSYGNAVRIRHADYNGRTLETLYAHLSQIDVQPDQPVDEGQKIGTTGSTGNSTGPHLHFEVRWGGKRYNPLCWLDDDFTSTPGWNPYTYGKGEHAVQRPQQGGVWGRGIDLSKHNWTNRAPVNFAKVRDAGAKFAILRAGYGSFEHQVDSYFNRAYGEAKAAGLAVGAYWYSYAVSEAEACKEARLFADTVKDKQLTMGLWFDQEYEPCILALTNAQRTAIVRTFCSEVERLTGKNCGLYCSRDWINTKLDAAQLTGTELWVAAYTGTDSPGSVALPYGIWQYVGGAGSWPGVDGPCDLNICYKDYPALYGESPQPPQKHEALKLLTGLTGKDLDAVGHIITVLGGKTEDADHGRICG